MSGLDFLSEMARRSDERVRIARAREPEPALHRRAMDTPVPSVLALNGFDVIAELKLRSPAAGSLQDREFDRTAQIRAYATGGACAVSVLTEPSEFHGELSDLQEAALTLKDSDVPVMRKDFLTQPYQLLEARAAGAGGALIIVTMLDDAIVRELLDCAQELGLFVLLEGFSNEDLDRIAELSGNADPTRVLAGVNSRNLKNLQVDFSRFGMLASGLPGNLRCVAESGVASPEDVTTVAGLGYRLALIGSALMTSGEPLQRLQSFIAAGRRVVTAQTPS